MGTKFFIKLFLLSVFLFSCSNKKKEYYDNGNLKAQYQISQNGLLEGKFISYFKNGNIKSIDLYRENIKVDSTIIYDSIIPDKVKLIYLWNRTSKDSFYVKNYEDNEVLNEGYIYKAKKVGKWKYYKDKKLEKVLEYINIKNETYLNQGWFFDKLGDTIKGVGNNYKFNYSVFQKKKQNEIDIFIKYNPLINNNSNVVLLFSEQLNKDFSNTNEIVFDTIFLTNNKVNFKYIVKKEGGIKLRGIIKEYANIVPTDSIVYKERLIYLDEEILISGNGKD